MPDLSLDLLGFHYQPLFMVCCCAGSVMYLFRGEFGSMLYTGDFRWETNSDKTQSGKNQILSILEGDKLDIVYLDNTYCNPLFSFPPRDVVAQQVHFFRYFNLCFPLLLFIFFYLMLWYLWLFNWYRMEAAMHFILPCYTSKESVIAWFSNGHNAMVSAEKDLMFWMGSCEAIRIS